jgi:hypothetical protein
MDTHTFFDARFSCRELKRFVRIALDWTIAAKLGSRAAHQTNDFRSRRRQGFGAPVDVAEAG